MDLRSLLHDILSEVSPKIINFQIEIHLLITWVRSSDCFRFVKSLRTCIVTSQCIQIQYPDLFQRQVAATIVSTTTEVVRRLKTKPSTTSTSSFMRMESSASSTTQKSSLNLLVTTHSTNTRVPALVANVG